MNEIEIRNIIARLNKAEQALFDQRDRHGPVGGKERVIARMNLIIAREKLRKALEGINNG